MKQALLLSNTERDLNRVLSLSLGINLQLGFEFKSVLKRALRNIGCLGSEMTELVGGVTLANCKIGFEVKAFSVIGLNPVYFSTNTSFSASCSPN